MKNFLIIFMILVIGFLLGIILMDLGFIWCVFIENTHYRCTTTQNNFPDNLEIIEARIGTDVFRNIVTFTLLLTSLAASFLYFIFDKIIKIKIENGVKYKTEEMISEYKVIFDEEMALNRANVYYEVALARLEEFEDEIIAVFRLLHNKPSEKLSEETLHQNIENAMRVLNNAERNIREATIISNKIKDHNKSREIKYGFNREKLHIDVINYKLYCCVAKLLFDKYHSDDERFEKNKHQYLQSRIVQEDIDFLENALQKNSGDEEFRWYFPYETIGFAKYCMGKFLDIKDMEKEGTKIIRSVLGIEVYPYSSGNNRKAEGSFLDIIRYQYGGIIIK